MEDPIYRRLGRVMEYFVKSSVNKDPERLEQMYYYYSNAIKKSEDNLIFRALEIDNQYCAYVYLLDHFGRVRWKNSGQPDLNDIELLENLANELLTTAPQNLKRQKLFFPENSEEQK